MEVNELFAYVCAGGALTANRPVKLPHPQP
jgi:hypothetical protein